MEPFFGLMINNKRSEQVGDGQRRNAGLGEDEGKKGTTAIYKPSSEAFVAVVVFD